MTTVEGRVAVLVTGMSGTGKSTALEGLARRGHAVLDTDDPGWKHTVATPAGPEPLWHLERIRSALDAHVDGALFVAGCVANQGEVYDRFGAVVLLRAPLAVLLARVGDRTNPYGSTAADRAAIARDLDAVEPLLRAGATDELDATVGAAQVVDRLEAVAVRSAASGPRHRRR